MRWAAAAFFRHWCFIFSSSEIGAFLLQAIYLCFLSPRVDRVWSLVQGEQSYPKYSARIDLAINLTTVVATEADMELTQSALTATAVVESKAKWLNMSTLTALKYKEIIVRPRYF